MTRGQEFRRGWRVLVACSFGIGFGLLPLPPYASGLFATALTAEFGWPRGKVLGAIILTTIALVLIGPWVGRFADRVGARKVAIWSTICLGICLALTSCVTSNILSFYAISAITSVVGLGTLPLTYAKILTGYFDSARGIALGIAFASTGVSGAFFPFYITTLMAHFGWRGAYIGMAGLPLLVALPILLLWLKDPVVAVVAPDQVATATPQDGMTVREALGRYRFWASAFAAMTLGAAVGGLLPNLSPLLAENGLDKLMVTRVLAVLALSVMTGRLLSGYLLDRLWAPLVAAILCVLAAVAILTLGIPNPRFAVMIAAIGALGLVAGAEVDLVAYITGKYFGERHFSGLYGIQYAIFGLGSGVSPALYGSTREATGSYHAALVLSVVLLVVATAFFMTLGAYPKEGQSRLGSD